MVMNRRNFVSAVGLGGLGVATTGWTATSFPVSQPTKPTISPGKEKAINHLITDYGAVPDGKTKNHRMIQAAIDACEAQGGGTVVVPAGVFLTGTLYLKDNVELHLSPGAVLLGSPDRDDYNADDFCPQNHVFDESSVTGAHLIVAVERKNVSITGPGRIDGNSKAFMRLEEPRWRRRVYSWRPGQMLYFCECAGVSIRSAELFNAPFWTCFLHGCEEVTVHRLRIYNDFRVPNGDGVDIDCCRNVTVSDCRIHTADDCLTLRGHNAPLKNKNRSCENVVVTNCVVASACSAIRVGVGDAPIRNCSFTNIAAWKCRTGVLIEPLFLVNSSGNPNEPRFEPFWANSSGTPVENLRFSDFVFDAGILFEVYPAKTIEPPASIRSAPLIRNVHFSRMSGTAQGASVIRGLPAHRISGISFTDIDLRISGGEGNAEDHSALRSSAWGAKFRRNLLPLGAYFGYIDGLSVRDMKMRWEGVSGPWKHGLVVDHCTDLMLDGVDIKMPEGAEKDVLIEE